MQTSGWNGFNALFRAHVATARHMDHCEYFGNSPPWIGRGLFVFVVVVLFQCIHVPLRNLFTHRTYSDLCVVMAYLPIFVVVLPLVLGLAIYSLFAPVLFLFQHWIYFGLFDLQHNTLQCIFTFCYMVIAVGIAVLLPHVWKFVYSDFHLYRYFSDKKPTPEAFADYAVRVYQAQSGRDWLIIEYFGTDIGGVVLTFLPRLHVWN